ncbi:MAG: hypothetical protein VX768_19995 [Planctomycetota bacterium]|nr:hypothetical protein [Planctomycetota bacterium]
MLKSFAQGVSNQADTVSFPEIELRIGLLSLKKRENAKQGE